MVTFTYGVLIKSSDSFLKLKDILYSKMSRKYSFYFRLYILEIQNRITITLKQGFNSLSNEDENTSSYCKIYQRYIHLLDKYS